MWCTLGSAGIVPAWSVASLSPPRAGSLRSQEAAPDSSRAVRGRRWLRHEALRLAGGPVRRKREGAQEVAQSVRVGSQPVLIDNAVFHDPLHVLASLGVRHELYPQLRFQSFSGRKPSFRPVRPRVVRRARKGRVAVHSVQQAAQVGGPEADVLLRVEEGPVAVVPDAGRACDPPARRRHDLHEPEGPGR